MEISTEQSWQWMIDAKGSMMEKARTRNGEIQTPSTENEMRHLEEGFMRGWREAMFTVRLHEERI